MVAVVLPTTATIMGDSLIYVVLPVSAVEFGIGEEFGLSAGFWIGVALSINRFVRLISNPFAATVYRRFGLRGPFITSVALGALTTLAYAFSQGIWLLLAARAVWGVCYSFLRLAAFLSALDPAAADMRGRLLGFFNAGQRLGSLIAVTAGAFLVAATDRTTGFIVIAAAGLIGVAISLRALPLKLVPVVRPDQSGPAARRSLSERAWDLMLSHLPVAARGLRWRLLSVAVLRGGLAFAANGLVIATVSPYLDELARTDRSAFGLAVVVLTLSGLLVGARWFSDLALSLPLGHLSDRIGRRRTVAGGMAVMFAAVAVLGLFDSLEAAIVGLSLLFVSSVAASTALDAEFGETVPDESRPPALGRYATWLDLGAAFGALAALPVAEAVGFQATYFIAGGVLLAMTAGYLAATASERTARAA